MMDFCEMDDLKRCAVFGDERADYPWDFYNDAITTHNYFKELNAYLRNLIVKGYNYFLVYYTQGAAVDFVYELLSLRPEYPDKKIIIELVIPNKAYEQKLYPNNSRIEYRGGMRQAESVTYIAESGFIGKKRKQRKYIVEKSDFVLSVSGEKPTLARKALIYAEKKGKATDIFSLMDYTPTAMFIKKMIKGNY